MKNILLILLTVFILTGCSKDDENNGIITDKNKDTSTKTPLLKKIISTINGTQGTTDYYYLEGNKIHQAVSNNDPKNS
ncbi:MAG: membrane lipoprotein lipid attachment site-containing protein [Flavobacteriales bacterium]|nr:membrane lipoprotein lipid attachment site-containing protein [Flavobacteriales bacterium]